MVFYAEGSDPVNQGVVADNIIFVDSTKITAEVPWGVTRGVQNFVSVRPTLTLTDPSRFGDLPFFVTAPTQFSISGTVNGLTGTDLVLQNNDADNLSVTADGSFTFATKITDGYDYNVTILAQPTGQICTVSNSSGTVTGADVTNVSVECVQAYTNASLNGDYLFIKTEINEIPAKFSEQAGTVSFDGVGTALAYGTERVSDGITVKTNTFSITVDYDVASDGSFTLADQSASQYLIHGQILLDGSSLLMDGTLTVGGSYLWKSVAMKRVASGSPPAYTNASLNGDYPFIFTEVYDPITLTFCDEAGTVSFDGAGNGLVDSTRRCSNGATVTTTSTSNHNIFYNVNSDGSFTLSDSVADPQPLHGQITLDGSSWLLDGTLLATSASKFLNQAVAMKRVVTGSPPTYTNASLNGDYLFIYTKIYNPGTTTFCDQAGTLSFDGAGTALKVGTERCSDGTTVTTTAINKTFDYNVIADGSFTLKKPDLPASLHAHGQIVLDGSSLLLDRTLKATNASKLLNQGVAMKR